MVITWPAITNAQLGNVLGGKTSVEALAIEGCTAVTALSPALEALRALPEGEPLALMAHEVAWGRFEGLEAFCIAHGLFFARWSGAYACQWGAERTLFTGSGEPQSYAADEDDYILMGRCTAERLGSYAAIIAHFDAADFAVPPLVITPEREEASNG